MNHILPLGLVTLAAFAGISRAELCLPDQWQGFMDWKSLELQPQPVFEKMNMHLFSDAINLKKAAFVNFTSHGGVESRHFQVSLYDKSGKGVTNYNVDLDTNVCVKMVDRNDTFDKICIPADAKNLGRRFLGIDGHGSVDVTDWGYQDHNLKRVVSAVTFGSNIIPVHMTANVATDLTFNEAVGYNHTIGIKDPAIFDIPKQCQQAIVELPADDPLATTMFRRFQFSKLF